MFEIENTQQFVYKFNQLNLNNKTLTLGSENSDFEITSDINIDNSNEGVITGGADFQLSGSFSASDGSLTSTGGEISLLEGGQLSSSGKLDVTDSTWILSGDFSKSGGTLTISETDFQLESSSTLTSDESLSFVTLNLNDFILTLGSSSSDLTVQNSVTIDTSTEGISTGEADLTLNNAFTMSNGSFNSSGL